MKLNIHLSYNPTILLPDIYSKEKKKQPCPQKDVCVNVHDGRKLETNQ